MKIIDKIWFTHGASVIGIVKTQSYDEVKYYIGTGIGRDEIEDAELIAKTGSRFIKEAGEVIFGTY